MIPLRRRRLVFALALFSALTVGGTSFVVHYRGMLRLGGAAVLDLEVHSWGVDAVIGDSPAGPKMGYPLLAATAALLASAVLAHLNRAVRPATAVATAFLLGVAASVATELEGFVAALHDVQAAVDAPFVPEWSVGPGIGLLLIGTLCTLAATAVALRPLPPEPDPYHPDLPTPPLGFPPPT